MGLGGVQRLYNIPKILKNLGWDVEICTPYPPYSYPKDTTSFKLDDLNIKRSFCPDPLHILPAKASTPGAGKRDYFSFPDNKVFWLPFLWKKINRTDIIVISCPPFSPALTVFLTKKTPCIIDYRDQWTGSYLGEYALKCEEHLAKKIEKKCIDKASAVVTVTKRIGEYLKGQYPENKNKIHLIRNGYSEEYFPKQIKKKKREEIILTYMGTFNEFEKPDLIFKGLKKLTEINPDLGNKILFKHIGHSRKKNIKQIADTIGFRSYISLGYKPHREALYEMINSDILILTGGKGENSKWHVPGKTYEYLRSGIPIIAITDNPELDTLIDSAGLVVNFDKEEIARAILKIVQNPELFKPVSNYKKYQWGNLAEEYSTLLSSLL
jgi:glycosyltransferase involved in cell wall biosynthesis